jgi:hypothetical protein
VLQTPADKTPELEVQMPLNDTTFHIYALCRPDGSPFYIGKAREKRDRSRFSEHKVEARSGHECHKCHVIRKYGYKVYYSVLYRTADEQDAYRVERALIAAIGRDLLANATDGGEGLTGRSGELSAVAKLTWEKVREIRRRYAIDLAPVKTLAAEFGISSANVEAIVLCKTWQEPDALKRAAKDRYHNSTIKGEQQKGAKLTQQQADEIRGHYATSGITTHQIAPLYGVNPGVILSVLRNETYHDPSYDASVYIPHKPAACGERNQGAKLTVQQVREIRARYVFRKITAKMLATEYGVTANHIEKIIRRELWRE